MAVNTYECMFILDSNRYARDAGALTKQLATVIEGYGGKMRASLLWDDRRLVYPIGAHRKGTYWLTYFDIESRQIVEIDRDFGRDEDIIRFLVIKLDPRIADAIVDHALTAPERAKTPSPAPSEGHRPRGGERRERFEEELALTEDLELEN